MSGERLLELGLSRSRLRDGTGAGVSVAARDHRPGRVLPGRRAPPGAFTLRATANIQGVSEDSLPESRYLHINALTTIGERYRQLHPSLSAQAAETRVKQALGVPVSLDAGLGAHAHAVAKFSHGAFLHNARAYAGGETAYVDALAAGIDAEPHQRGESAPGEPAPGSKRAKGTVAVGQGNSSGEPVEPLHQSLESAESSGLLTDSTESTLSTFSTSSFIFVDASSAVEDASRSLEEVARAVERAGARTARRAAASAVVSTVLRGLASDIGSAVVSIAVEALFSAIFPSDPNQEVISAIQKVSSQVKQLQDSVDQLSAFIGSAFRQVDFRTKAGTLRPALATIDTAWLGPDGNGNGYLQAVNQAAQGNQAESALNSLTQVLPGGTSYQSIPALANAQTQSAGAQLGTSPGIPSLMAQFRDLVSPRDWPPRPSRP